MSVTSSDGGNRYADLGGLRLHCSMLAEDAIKAAIRDYHSKIQGKTTGVAGSIDVSQSVSIFILSASAHADSGYQVTTGKTVAEARPGQA